MSPAGPTASGRPGRRARGARSPRPRSLQRRLGVGILGVVLVMSALMGCMSTLTLRHSLLERLDVQLQAASSRAEARRHGDGQGPAGGAADDAGGTAPSPGASADPTTCPSTTGNEHRGGPPPGLDAPGQSTGTLTVIAPGDRAGGAVGQPGQDEEDSDDEDDDEEDDSEDLTAVEAGFIGESGTYCPLPSRATDMLLDLDATGSPQTVHVPHLGNYRVIVAKDALTGDVVITGLSMEADNSLVRGHLLLEVLIAVVGALLAATAGRAMVRSQLAPLERVAGTAERVAAQPLATGEVTITERVADSDLASSQEVGTVGGALNTLLGHVQDALAARQRSETQVRQFVADASHELRTPLASIRGYTELIRRQGADADLPPESLHALERVHSESVRMTALVEDLLLLARLDAGRELRRDDVDLLAILLDTVSDARAAGADHDWELDLSALEEVAEPPEIRGDEARLRQVMVNLLANARVHTPAGTHVTVGLHREEGPGRAQAGGEDSAAPSCQAGAEQAQGGGSWVVTVADDGPGIDPSVRDRLFERFARADASRERRTGSTGLGMSIALAIVRSHGGTLTVDSHRAGEPGGTGGRDRSESGTTFTVRLPA